MSELEPEICEKIVSKKVLVLWGPGCSTEELEDFSRTLLSQASKVTFENAERLSLAQYAPASFEVILSNYLAPYSVDHSLELLSEIMNLLKPNGIMFGKEKSLQNIQTYLTLAGFCTILTSFKDPTTFSALKPNFEVGSSSRLSFEKPSVWSLANDLMDEEVDLIDQDELLEEADLLKPANDSLRVCGTTGKRKACKDCSCGLAEELLGVKGSNPLEKKVTSSCGSCYLGDAFRCATCPYMGMPAFRPGEKIKLLEK